MILALNLAFCIALTYAGTVNHGGNCSIANNRLDTATHKLLTDCDDTTFCTPQNTCQPKQCRRDEFPFGYHPGAILPPLCPHGQYCPDEGSACAPRLALGQTCQLNRDDECASPPLPTAGQAPSRSMHLGEQSPMKASGSTSSIDASICLHFTCMYANATLGTPCIVDTTIYLGLGPKGAQFSTAVTRDNCRPGLFCNAGVCVRAVGLGQPCQRDQGCISYNCNVQNVCANPPETPIKVPAWQYVLTGVTVLVAMFATCVILILVHKRHRRLRYAEVREYYREQLGYRKSIIALHSAAANSRVSSVYGQQKHTSFGSARTVMVSGGYVRDGSERAREKRCN